MTRRYCQRCQRPESACICQLIVNVNNDCHVVILQHPSEVKQAKGTVTLLEQCLDNCQVIVGENFTENNELNQLLEKYQDNIHLLYPSEGADVVTAKKYEDKKRAPCIILLDGTWKKAYKMYMLSKNLHAIAHLCLPEGVTGRYLIRQTKKNNALSTLEACSHALAIIEQSPKIYQALLRSFEQFNQLHLSYKQS